MREKNIRVILAAHNRYITLLTLMNFQSTDWNVRFRHTRRRSIISKCSPSGQHWDFSPETPESTSSAKYTFSPTTKVDESGKSTSLIVWNDLWVPECTFEFFEEAELPCRTGYLSTTMFTCTFRHHFARVGLLPINLQSLKIRNTIIWLVENGINGHKDRRVQCSGTLTLALLALLPRKLSFFRVKFFFLAFFALLVSYSPN